MSFAAPKNAARPGENADLLRAKVRRAQPGKLPYVVVVGDEDMAGRVVLPRTRPGAGEGSWRAGGDRPNDTKIPVVGGDPDASAGITMT